MNALTHTQSVPALFDAFFNPSLVTRYAKSGLTLPATNIKDTEAAYHIEVAIPGIRKENFTLNVVQNVLTLTVKQEPEPADEYIRREFAANSVERSFRLPKTVHVEAIQATYTDGVLRIELPKIVEPAPVVKQIEIA